MSHCPYCPANLQQTVELVIYHYLARAHQLATPHTHAPGHSYSKKAGHRDSDAHVNL